MLYRLHTVLISTCFMLLASLAFFPSAAQEKPGNATSRQLSFTVDNDYFMFQGKDGYYTNGLYFQYSTLAKKTRAGVVKKIRSYGLNQMIYNAFTRRIYPNIYSGYPGGPGFIDRPITGYLFAEYKQTEFKTTHRLLQLGISGGTIGKASFGREVQTGWHKEAGVGNYWNWAWNYQLKSEFGLNVQGLYAASLIKNSRSLLQITPITTASLGSIFTNASQSVLVQLGKFNPMSESTFWNARLGNSNEKTTNKTEFFFYYKPQLMYQLYNATVQGGLLRKDKGPITSKPQPFVTTHELGITLATGRYSAGYASFFEGKEAKSQLYTHPYARINIAYRF